MWTGSIADVLCLSCMSGCVDAVSQRAGANANVIVSVTIVLCRKGIKMCLGSLWVISAVLYQKHCLGL